MDASDLVVGSSKLQAEKDTLIKDVSVTPQIHFDHKRVCAHSNAFEDWPKHKCVCAITSLVFYKKFYVL
jgi:hypothetical protein